ncbi:MAG: NUDIX hydrolase [Dehalococcoidia bacterium]
MGLLNRGHREQLERGLLGLWTRLPRPLKWASLRVLFPSRPVGVAAVIRDTEGRILLVRQSYRRREWALVGGYAGWREDLRHAAERETREEVGLRVRAGRLLAANTGAYGHLRVGYACELLGDPSLRLGFEVVEAAWFAPDALPPIPADIRQFLDEVLAAWDPLGAPPGAAPGTLR